MPLSKRRRKSIKPIDTLDRFPLEIWAMILDHCDLLTRLDVGQVSWPLYNLINNRTKRIFTEFKDKLLNSEDREIDEDLDRFGQACGFILFPLYQSDGCELTLHVSYHIYFRDFIERPKPVKRFRDICRKCNRYLIVVGPVLTDFLKYRPDLDLTRFDLRRYADKLSPNAIRTLEIFFNINWEKENRVSYDGLDKIESRRAHERWYLSLYINQILNKSMETVAGGKYYFKEDDDRQLIDKKIRSRKVYRLVNSHRWIYDGFDEIRTEDLTKVANYLVDVSNEIYRSLN